MGRDDGHLLLLLAIRWSSVSSARYGTRWWSIVRCAGHVRRISLRRARLLGRSWGILWWVWRGLTLTIAVHVCVELVLSLHLCAISQQNNVYLQ